MSQSPFVITVSRQLGSGGACLGKRVAESLGILYLDREILSEAAKHFQLTEGDLEELDEKTSSFWRSFLKAGTYITPEIYIDPPVYVPTDQEFFQVEAKIIERVAREDSAVIIGRGGSFVLRNHPRHLSVFLHADLAFRLKRVRERFNLSEKEARELIEQTDKERARYLQTFTGRDWKDVRQYHLAIDTGAVSLEEATELVLACAKSRFGLTAV